MELLSEFLLTKLDFLQQNNIKLLITGRIDGMPERVQTPLYNAISATCNNTALTLIIALNYGGRCEITDAARTIGRKIQTGEISAADITEEMLSKAMYNPTVPDPELIIRTSGESRLSNFLLWQIAYAEIYFTKTYWPDFHKKELYEAIFEYQKRNRRFGGLNTK